MREDSNRYDSISGRDLFAACKEHCAELQTKLEALERDLAEAQQDTERLDWLEDPTNQVWEICAAGNPFDPLKVFHIDWKDFGSAASGETWRKAIDAAIGKS